MKKFIKENWFKLAILLVIAGLFYWHEWRPSEIKKDCFFISKEGASYMRVTYSNEINFIYENCLRENGL
jgi:hypothetical protein